MTPSQQPAPQELNPSYPVTWEELRNMYVDGLSLDKYDEILLRKTCSRPLSSAPDITDEQFIEDKIKFACEKHDAAIAAQARAGVLKDIEIYIHDGLKSCKEPWDVGYATCGGDVLNVIKSLRQPKENTDSTGDEKR